MSNLSQLTFKTREWFIPAYDKHCVIAFLKILKRASEIIF